MANKAQSEVVNSKPVACCANGPVANHCLAREVGELHAIVGRSIHICLAVVSEHHCSRTFLCR